MSDLVLRPAKEATDRWVLQLRRNGGMPETEYVSLARGDQAWAREIVRAGAPFWLFGDPLKTDSHRAAGTLPPRLEPVSPWQPIATAPKGVLGGIAPTIDILAKVWRQKTDDFAYHRFVDCRWFMGDSSVNLAAYWSGVGDAYLAVAWMPAPPIPKEFP